MNRAAIKSCSAWAESYRVMGNPYPGPYSFKYHPWSRAIHDTKAEFNVGMKAAQMGYTEAALNISFYTLDILKQDVLYVLPNLNPDAANFSASRFDTALELSPHLKAMFSDVQNVGHKKAGMSSIFIRGSGSRTGLKNLSTPKVILDETEEMEQDNIPLAFERTSGQLEQDRLIFMLSTPQVFNDGIHKYFTQSSQEQFVFRCPHCSKITHLHFPDSLVVCGDDEHDTRVNESYIRCPLCKVKLDHESKVDWLKDGYWEPTVASREMRGFQISQLYAMHITPKKLAVTCHKATKDLAQEQELWNSKAGLPHETEGARVLDSQIDGCLGEHGNGQRHGTGVVCMGVDVGQPNLHIEIDDYHFDDNSVEDVNAAAKARVLFHGTRTEFEELDVLMNQYGVRACVIDANPERRKAHEFAMRHPGRVFLCFYGNNVKGKMITYNEEASTITVDRTSWLDMSLGRFKNGTIRLPVDTNSEYKRHIKAQVRVYEDDKSGNKVGRYKSTDADHYGHSRNYVEMALPLGYNFRANVSILGSVV